MKFDNYCIGLVVLVLFFMYLDNSVNVEAFSMLDGSDVDGDVALPAGPGAGAGPPTKPAVKVATKQVVEDIGEKPAKLAVATTPPSLRQDIQALSSSSDALTSLDDAFTSLVDPQLITQQVPANLQNLGSRVGGPANLGNPSLGTIGGPAVLPSGGTNQVMGLPILDNPSIGAPIGYAAPVVSDMGGAPTAIGAPPVATNAGPKKKVEVHMVYTTWCGHSKRAEPHLDKLKQEVHGKDMGNYTVEVHKHDADTPEGKQVAKEHNVKGFPTHFILVEGKKIGGSIGRTYDELMGKLKELTDV
jgi:thiol-disulfide isomerase/thioredoxin